MITETDYRNALAAHSLALLMEVRRAKRAPRRRSLFGRLLSLVRR